jgi:hypothetical protein
MGSDLSADDPVVWSQSGETCGQCDEPISFGETLVMVQVVRPEIYGSQPTLMPLLDDEGDFLYEHYFLHFGCWESIQEDLSEELEDTPPVEDEFGITRCEVCGSAIREWETCAAITHGEFHRSRRAPDGTHGVNLVPNGAPDVLCIHCLSLINEEQLEMWEDGVSQDGECRECQHSRCWRDFDCACPCHEEQEEEDGDT